MTAADLSAAAWVVLAVCAVVGLIAYLVFGAPR